jgi:hypothetical protein
MTVRELTMASPTKVNADPNVSVYIREKFRFFSVGAVDIDVDHEKPESEETFGVPHESAVNRTTEISKPFPWPLILNV